jgi:hypothetical protein
VVLKVIKLKWIYAVPSRNSSATGPILIACFRRASQIRKYGVGNEMHWH